MAISFIFIRSIEEGTMSFSKYNLMKIMPILDEDA